MKQYKLEYNQPIPSNTFSPGDWNNALPIGNGRLGAMIFGGVNRDFIQLNEETVWFKGKTNRVNKDARESLKEIQKLVLDGKLTEAEQKIELTMHSTPPIQGHYEPLSNVIIKMIQPDFEYKNYKRSLDLNNALVNIEYDLESCHYSREYFCSAPDNAIFIKYSVNESSQLSFYIYLNRDKSFDDVEVINENTIALRGKCGGDNGVAYNCALKVIVEDGSIEILGDKILVTQATTAYMIISGYTDFDEIDPKEKNLHLLNELSKKTYEEIKNNHIKDYQYYFNRMEIDIFDDNQKNTESFDIDKMLDDFKNDKENLSLIPIYFQFGRYLMISSSRENTFPSNLQGIWNKDYQPAWDSKYTININTEMNYWPAEVCNLSECHLSLFNLLEKMYLSGKQVAKEMYGCNGFVAHHNTDIWGDCAPQGQYISSSQWCLGAAWLCTHIYEHYLFTKDKEFLKKYYYLMEESAKFIIDFLIFDNDGYLVTCPSLSPENQYHGKDGLKHHITYAPTSDIQIINTLFDMVKDSIRILNLDTALASKIDEIQKLLPPMKIGKYGQLQEWIEDYTEVEPGHRHMAHLLGVYPFHMITIDDTPELAKAAIKTIERREYYGNKNGYGWFTGWARAWLISIWARLMKEEKAKENLYHIFKQFTSENLFDLHPPFQIDGNFGAIAGIAEMLIQSSDNEIRLLPSLPESWKNGKVIGIKARGNLEVDIYWENHEIKKAIIHPHDSHTINIMTKTPCYINNNSYNKKYENKYYIYEVTLENSKDCVIEQDVS